MLSRFIDCAGVRADCAYLDLEEELLLLVVVGGVLESEEALLGVYELEVGFEALVARKGELERVQLVREDDLEEGLARL